MSDDMISDNMAHYVLCYCFSLFMIHDGGDGDQDCAPPLDGIMGNEYSGWSMCSVRELAINIE